MVSGIVVLHHGCCSGLLGTHPTTIHYNIKKTNNYPSHQLIELHDIDETLLNSLNIKNTFIKFVGNPGHDLGHAQKYGGVKPVNVIPNLPS